MTCPDAFKPDFFNNIAAIAVVLMFTKVVMHRSRQGSGGRRGLAVLHVGTVLSAGLAIVVSLRATDACGLDPCLHRAAWVFLAATAVGLLADLVVEDLGSAFDWKISKRQP